MALYLLHGTLHCTIYEAEDLVDELRFTGQAPKFLRKVVEKIEDKVKLGKGPSRIYATIELGKSTVGRTRIVADDPVNPEWNESFHIYCAHSVSNVIINVKSDDTLGAHVIGRATIPLAKILPEKPLKDTYEIFIEGNSKKRGKVEVKLQYTSVQKDPSWGSGLQGQNYQGVPFTFFPQRSGCRITLYQDAHMEHGFLPKISLDRGMLRQETRCWEDIHNAISSAKYFIYIAGWSVHTAIRLVRDQNTGEGQTLGELLTKKADEGCRVLLLVWDDRTSNRGMPNLSIMGTHDEETFNYFKSTNVKCLLCPRNPDSGLSIVQGMTVGAMFSHHQKTITVDAEISPSSPNRTIVSFVGGIDLCDGRYDNQKHSLFHTLKSVHKDDFYNGCFKGSALEYGGPREPWHDIHAKIEGPAAWDVLTNFEQRWLGQGQHGYLLDIPKIRDIIPMTPVTEAFDPETWNAQIFRSIDAGAVFGLPSTPDEASNMGLVSGKDLVFEKSIQHAYIHAIRRAKNFIYIENQYFLGGCASWNSMQDTGCDHLIPIELALKIARKIEAGERFTVYIVIPMWPEGIPESFSVQPILDWQRKTMEMMYREISQALITKGMYDAHPRDYLSFFCLGNREIKMPGEYEPVKSVQEPIIGEHYRKAQENRRFMIYVHSKMMIVDDEYIILGSANINQRSMDGARDTEIAVGAYQPHHTCMDGSSQGQIHGFRMSLWYEHMGILLDDFLHPNSSQCMRRVNELSNKIWEEFIAEEGPDTRNLSAHLMPYPVEVKEDGSVSLKEGYQCFPDTKATVLGSRSPLPPVLTT